MLADEQARTYYEACPLCESVSASLIGYADCSDHVLYNPELPDTINWQQCDACNHIFTDGYFTDEALSILFSKANNHQLLDKKNVEQARATSARIVDNISSVLGKQEGKWLDVGFGNGGLLITCGEYGFDSVGIDLRQEAVNQIAQLGIQAHCINFLDFCQFNSFSVISMADVLEHIPYPKKALAHAYKLLTPSGVLFISCPNTDSIVWEVLSQAHLNPYWAEIEHYHNFGRKRLYSLLIENGFSPVNYSISQRYRIGMEVISIKSINSQPRL